jgi:uncharacterized protein YeaO (DUF488 family)
MFRLKRAYEPAKRTDGFRVLVERLWPRGLSKQRAKLDQWLKDVAPSTALRKWFGHDPQKWNEFRKRYRGELKTQSDAVDLLSTKARKGSVTLVYGSKDEEHNAAVALKEYLEARRR